MTGPQEARFLTALRGADDAKVTTDGAVEWSRCAQLLSQVADSIAFAAGFDQDINGQTGPQMGAAFTRTSGSMRERSADLRRGHQALADAASAISDARAAQQQMDAQWPAMDDPGPRVTTTPDDIKDGKAPDQARHNDQVARYEATSYHREATSKKWADHVDTVYAGSTATMKSISGYQDPAPTSGGGGHQGSRGAGGPSPFGLHASGGGRSTAHGSTSTWGPSGRPTHPGTGAGQPVPAGPGHAPGTSGPTGHSPASGGAPHDPTPSIGAPTPGTGAPAGGTPGTTPTSPVAVAGLAAGGLLGGAGLLSGIRGGLGGLGGGLSTSGLSAGAVEPIGGSARAASAGSVLGRGAAPGAAGVAEEEGVAGGRGTAGRAGGSGGLGREGGARSGSAGSRGARGAARTGGGAGRGSRRRDDERGDADRDLFDDGQDWLDDEGAAPAVLD